MSGPINTSSWAGPDDAMRADPPTHYHAQSRLLVTSDRGSMPPLVDRCATALAIDARAGPLSLVTAPGHGFAMLWCVWTQAPTTMELDMLDNCLTHSAMPVTLDVSGDAIDPAWERFGDYDVVNIVINPDEGECLSALTRGQHASKAAMHSPLEDARVGQLDRLQEEVSRIARMLSRLDEGDTRLLIRSPDGSREPPSPFIEDHVRSPARDYAGTDAINPLGSAPVAARPPVSAREVRRLVRLRRAREQFFAPDLFADPAWDMLLDLYAARLERNRVSVSSLCIAAAVPATTALRWIKSLTVAGMFERREDPHDGRRIFVALSDQATEAMHRYFASIVDEGIGI